MSKAYLLVILLFAASFTGCMSGSDDNTETDTTIDDETKQEEETEKEEEMIDPVGQEPFEDSSTDCVCNCTLIVEDNSYNPEHFSSVFISSEEPGHWEYIDETYVWIENQDGNHFTTDVKFRGFFNKTGNNVHITPLPYNETNLQHYPYRIEPFPLTSQASPYFIGYWYKITIQGPDGLYWQDHVKFVYAVENYGRYDVIWNDIDIDLSWEPVGFTIQYTGEYSSANHGDSHSHPSVTRPF